MVTDPIADLLTRIRNALHARHLTVPISFSKMNGALLKILKESSFIDSFVKEEIDGLKQFKVFLKYQADKKPAIRKLLRLSKPGGRIYQGYRTLRPVLGGLGIKILSTPKGVMTGKQARAQKLGGEVLCEVS